eukprot:scaffold1706_cov116-Cylindrotheca_fusiformis.AAC.12
MTIVVLPHQKALFTSKFSNESKVMSYQDHETISLAIKSIEKAVGRIVKHRSVDKKAQRQIQHLLDHTRHLLFELFEKRKSLEALIAWFRDEWKRIEPKLAESSLPILQHAMENMLRMSDGLVMLSSGECRHPFDIEQGKTSKFRSKLSTVKERQDGYTCLYKADAVYSGFGWDEFTNENVGIQERLVAILKRYVKSPWDFLERKGATQLLESCLDQQEFAVKELQQHVQGLKKQILNDIQLRLKPTKLSFVTQDKMERLFVAYGTQVISLERQADNFQIEKESVLPSHLKQPTDWAGHSLHIATQPTSMTANNNRKRRLVIDDSDNDSSDGVGKGAPRTRAPDKMQATTGLKVRVETTKPKTETEDSLRAIKTQMGVDVQGLETSREELEQENERIRLLADSKEEKTKRLKRILDRVVARQDVDDNEVWDARECLRQAHMELGNELLWSARDFEKALNSFNEAKSLVCQQQSSHHRVVESTNDDTSESRYIQRNLVFLLGQATVNAGICHVEWAQKENKGVIKRRARQAISEFCSVRELTIIIRQRAERDKQQSRAHSSDWKASIEDSLRADQLESLACRWMGLSMWLISQEKEAISALEHAASFFKSNTIPRKELIAAMLEVAAECVYATCSLTDLVCSAMEDLHRNEKERGDELLCVVKRALRRNVEIVGRLEQLVAEKETEPIILTFQEESEISSSREILDYLTEIECWWQKKRAQSTTLLAKESVPRLSSILPRTDVFPAGPDKQRHSGPTAHIILSEGRRQRKRRMAGSGGFENFHSQSPVRALQQHPKVASDVLPLRFRKWGDELLRSRTKNSPDTRGVGASLPYPSVAPPMPDDIKVYIEASAGQ